MQITSKLTTAANFTMQISCTLIHPRSSQKCRNVQLKSNCQRKREIERVLLTCCSSEEVKTEVEGRENHEQRETVRINE